MSTDLTTTTDKGKAMRRARAEKAFKELNIEEINQLRIEAEKEVGEWLTKEGLEPNIAVKTFHSMQAVQEAAVLMLKVVQGHVPDMLGEDVNGFRKAGTVKVTVEERINAASVIAALGKTQQQLAAQLMEVSAKIRNPEKEAAGRNDPPVFGLSVTVNNELPEKEKAAKATVREVTPAKPAEIAATGAERR